MQLSPYVSRAEISAIFNEFVSLSERPRCRVTSSRKVRENLEKLRNAFKEKSVSFLLRNVERSPSQASIFISILRDFSLRIFLENNFYEQSCHPRSGVCSKPLKFQRILKS